ncbi:hypothetical protein [Heyndrickxia camelliae]|uniref:hypothetical protein n=1 Tax=Heyndrickxia camelliae TaxID=1707093 RepID=UPI0013FE427D|nr:hypothetical protein [Heyndrickxia camelliae]
MNKYCVTISQNGGEYDGDIFIKCDELIKIDNNTVCADGIEINFDYEYIIEIKKEGE